MAISTRSRQLAEQVQAAVKRQYDVPGLRVEVEGATIRLCGEVAHAGERRAVAELVRQMMPEQRIDVRLTLSPAGHARDEALQQAAMQAIDAHPEMADEQMAVLVEGGRARLIGQVTRPALLAEAIDLVQRIPGIQDVDTSELQASTPTAVSESAATRLEAALALDSRLESVGLAVSVRNGVAQLSGEVRQPSERLAAVEIAARQPDVRRVIARITVAHTESSEDELLASALGADLPSGCEARVLDGTCYLFGELGSDDQQVAEAIALAAVPRVVSLIRTAAT